MRTSNATTSLNNWDYSRWHIQQEIAAGEFISAETTLLAAGPPSLGMTAYHNYQIDGTEIPAGDTGVVYPLGVIENFGMNQAQQVQRIFEIGSSRAYFIPGKVIGTLTLGRVLHSGPSLLKVMYAYYRQTNPQALFKFMNNAFDSELSSNYGFKIPDPNKGLLDLPDIQKLLLAIREKPGEGDLFMNLASDLFKQPTGLMVYFRNSLDQDFGAIYLEQVHVTGHQFSLNAAANVLMEGASAEFERVRPVNVQISDYVPAMAAN